MDYTFATFGGHFRVHSPKNIHTIYTIVLKRAIKENFYF